MAIKPVPGYSTYTGSTYALPKKKPVPKAPVPFYLSTPAADLPGYKPPGAPGYTPPTGTMYAGYPNLAAATAGIAPPPGTGTNPNIPPPSGSYMTELENDPLYQNVMDSYTSAVGGARTNLRDQMRSALIQSGFDIRPYMTGGLAAYAGDITDADVLAGQQNPLSQKALLDQGLGRQQNELGYQLAGRGMLRSGDLVSGNDLQQQQYDIQSNAGMQNLLSTIRSGVGSYDDLLASQGQSRNAALESIASRLAQRQGLTYDDGSGDTSGVPGTGGTTGVPTAPSSTPPPLGPVMWGGRPWTSRAALSRYLKAHGDDPNLWQHQHHDAYARLGA